MGIAPLIEDPEKHAAALAFSEDCIVRQEDVPWLIESCKTTSDDHIHRAFAELIGFLTRVDSPYINQVLDACQQDFILGKTMRWLTEPLMLESADTKKIRENYRQQKKREEKKPHLVTPPPAERVRAQLALSEAGNVEAWVHLIMELTLERDSQVYNFVTGDIEALPGWASADDDTRARIVSAAKHYILNGNPKFDTLFQSNTYTQSMVAAWPALDLLYNQDREFLSKMSKDLWQKWVPIIVGFFTGDKEGDLRKFLLALVYQKAPEDFLENVRKKIQNELGPEHGYPRILQEMMAIWDERLARVFVEKLHDPTVPASSMGNLLNELIEKDVQEAVVFARSLLASPVGGGEATRDRVLVAAGSLVRWRAAEYWDSVWSVIQNNLEFGRDLMLRVASGSRRGQSIQHELPEKKLAALYVWLERQFPAAQDPQHDKGHVVRPRDELVRFRDSIIQALKAKGTSAACVALELIVDEFPDRPWLKWSLEEARKITRRSTWLPPSPREVLTMLANPHSRIVRTGEELLDVVTVSLARLQEKLRGVTPMAFQYWDESAKRPKTETRISDAVKDHLQTDLKANKIIVNREVEVRNLNNRGVGDRTDILVQTFSGDGPDGHRDIISAVIETKGCWNSELATAMESQLKMDYLTNSGYYFGLYLVGWFFCDRWEAADPRKSACAKFIGGRTLPVICRDLEAQARELSDEKYKIRSFILDATY